MNKIYSRLGWFTTGVITGVVGVFLYQVLGKPALPKVEKCKLDFWAEYDPPETFYPAVRGRIADISWMDKLEPAPPEPVDDWYAFEQSFDDTQPVRTHE